MIIYHFPKWHIVSRIWWDNVAKITLNYLIKRIIRLILISILFRMLDTNISSHNRCVFEPMKNKATVYCHHAWIFLTVRWHLLIHKNLLHCLEKSVFSLLLIGLSKVLLVALQLPGNQLFQLQFDKQANPTQRNT